MLGRLHYENNSLSKLWSHNGFLSADELLWQIYELQERFERHQHNEIARRNEKKQVELQRTVRKQQDLEFAAMLSKQEASPARDEDAMPSDFPGPSALRRHISDNERQKFSKLVPEEPEKGNTQ